MHLFQRLRWPVAPIVFALDFDDHLLHLFCLSGPLIFAHLLLPPEKLLVGLTVASSESIPKCRELPVVVVEVQVVHRVASGAIDNGRIRDVLPVVDHDGPDLDKGEESNVCKFLEWEDEWEDVVWHALAVTVEGVESMRSVRCWHNPFVVRLVKAFVDERVVQSSVDPVDTEVGEHQEHWELEVVVPWA